jgi:thiol-disulfide isomerase/thioredoxin
MKGKLLIITFFFTSSLLPAQVSDNTYDDSRSVASGKKYGELILELPIGAKLYKNHFIKAQELLDNIKTLCKGKAIFIDFWATWCSPCLEAMPNNRRLYQETKNLPVEFIYICTDYRSTIDDWITKISILKQPGIHIYVNDEIIRELWKLLPTNGGFPTYVFIDSKGVFRPGAIPLNSSTTTERLSVWIEK